MKLKSLFHKIVSFLKGTSKKAALKIHGINFNNKLNDFEFEVQYLHRNIWLHIPSEEILQYIHLKTNLSLEDFESVVRHNERLKTATLNLKSIIRIEDGTSLFLLEDINNGNETLHTAANIIKYKLFSLITNEQCFSLGHLLGREEEVKTQETVKEHVKILNKQKIYSIKSV